MTDSWKELNRAIQKNFIKDKYISNKVDLNFLKSEKGVISLVIDGIDNNYVSSMDTEEKWEIYLKSDGTWEIA